jgi:MurNAc alpha-1-phosphate uridylyltransferase
VAINREIYCDFDFARLPSVAEALGSGAARAHLVMVGNPPHHPGGDFSLSGGKVSEAGPHRLTFSGIGAYTPALFAGVSRGAKCQLVALLKPAMAKGAVSGEHHTGLWMDVGTPQRLGELEQVLVSGSGR